MFIPEATFLVLILGAMFGTLIVRSSKWNGKQ